MQTEDIKDLTEIEPGTEASAGSEAPVESGKEKSTGQKKRVGKWVSAVVTILLLGAIAAFTVYVNRGIDIRGLYMDDLYMWSCYGEQSLLEFAFPIGTSTRFRPVYWLATYLQMALIGSHVEYFVPFNIVLNILTAWTVFGIAKKIGGGRISALLAALCYSASRFAYYQIGQALGLMETMATWFSLMILYLLYRYQTNRSLEPPEPVRLLTLEKGERLALKRTDDGLFGWALVCYFLLAFTHERYIVLAPLFYVTLFFKLLRAEKGRRKAYFLYHKGKWAAPAVVFAVIWTIRRLAIGRALPAGTGGTQVTETFSLPSFFENLKSQLFYMLGLNAGPEHLCGIPWDATHPMIKAWVRISVIALGILGAMYVIAFLLELRTEKGRKNAGKSFGVLVLFGGFIGLCAAASSATIRVEMRWIYVSWTAAVILCTYLIRFVCLVYEKADEEDGQEEKTAEAVMPDAFGPTAEVSAAEASTAEEPAAEEPAAKASEAEEPEEKMPEVVMQDAGDSIFSNAGRGVTERIFRPWVMRAVLGFIFAVYAVLSIRTNMYYRTGFEKLYFWPDQLRMNSLADETIGRYGREGVFGKTVYIVENSYGMSDFYARTFFKPFDEEKTAGGTRICFAESEAAVPAKEKEENRCIIVIEVPEKNAYKAVFPETDSKG